MADALTPPEAFKLAVSRLDTQAVAGALIGRTQSRVSKMVRAGKPCPPEAVLRLEAATGVSRHDLRPDIYPREGESPCAGSLGDLEAAR